MRPHLLRPLALALLAATGAASCTRASVPGAVGSARDGARAAADDATGNDAVGLPPVGTSSLTGIEARLRDAVRARHEAAIALLGRAVDVPSGTHNVAGVRRVGELFAAEFRALGFTTRWVALPDSLQRAGHLVAEHAGRGGPRLLLIGHLDTVFEGEGTGWSREGDVGRGAGSGDMKGGDVAMLLALQALADAGRLADLPITVVLTGDEELPGRPLAVTRAALVEAARRSDVALAFEGGSATHVAIGRRGASTWRLEVTARQAHSSGIFSADVGYGAIYEGTRILDAFRRELGGERGLTYNVGLVGGGARVAVDSSGSALTAAGKDNIVPPAFHAMGDLRFLRDSQKEAARARMRAIVQKALPGAQATITFEDGYPAMPVTAAGERLLALYDGTSRALGYPAVSSTAPERRGAGDVSFVAALLPGIDGLGVDGSGAHSPRESVSLSSLRMSAERAAVFMHRLHAGWSPR